MDKEELLKRVIELCAKFQMQDRVKIAPHMAAAIIVSPPFPSGINDVGHFADQKLVELLAVADSRNPGRYPGIDEAAFADELRTVIISAL